eukprot:TRINITY_DN10743_c0_g2_i5.p1 TRINITY_DN10743_c0_g2~~TRINITY_DN10743_c0_g2_i5.p1  ORF type:complete len:178 (+),score=1.01 TRINITY_DN10743_c0_g2_i5:242-775(+)
MAPIITITPKQDQKEFEKHLRKDFKRCLGLRKNIPNLILRKLLNFSQAFLENKTQRSTCKIKRRFQNQIVEPAPKIRLTKNLKLLPKSFFKIINLLNLAECKEHGQRMTILHFREHGIPIPDPDKYLEMMTTLYQEMRKIPFNTLLCVAKKEDEEKTFSVMLNNIHNVTKERGLEPH